MTRRIVRPMLGSLFLVRSDDAVQDPSGRASRAKAAARTKLAAARAAAG
ncbi:MAG: hypothetical protein V9G08_13205 [Dermatophilaceae bacterium]